MRHATRSVEQAVGGNAYTTCVPPAKLHSLWDLWERLWCSWQLLGDSVSVQWVPSHVGVQGNEQADRRA